MCQLSPRPEKWPTAALEEAEVEKTTQLLEPERLVHAVLVSKVAVLPKSQAERAMTSLAVPRASTEAEKQFSAVVWGKE